MSRVFFLLIFSLLLSACAVAPSAEKKITIGKARCVVRDCRQFSAKVLGQATEFVGATFEIIDPKEFRGKTVALFVGYDQVQGPELLQFAVGAEVEVDLSRADIAMLPDGSLQVRSPFNFSFKKAPNQSLQPTALLGRG